MHNYFDPEWFAKDVVALPSTGGDISIVNPLPGCLLIRYLSENPWRVHDDKGSEAVIVSIG